ncbi:MAG: family 16 glycosylhydrolase, partial [Armatimonadota bacterium]
MVQGKSIRRGALAATLAAALLLILALPCHTQSVESNRGDWIPTFIDEFNGSALDSTKWTPSNGVFDNREQTVHYFLPRNVTVDGGRLRIRSTRETYRNPRDSHQYAFTSGEVRTLGKLSQRFGRFEVRCRFPRTPGIWSAFFLLPDDDSWPPEIDVTEYIGIRPNWLYLTHHWKDIRGQHEQMAMHLKPAPFSLQEWHTYAIEWEPGVIRRFIDGKPMGTATYGVPDVPLYLRLNTAIGGVFAGTPADGPWPQTYEIDFVRVYRRADQPVPPPPNSVSIAALHRSENAARIDTRPEPATRGPFWDSLGLVLLLVIVPVGFLLTAKSPDREARRTRLIAVVVSISAVNYIIWRCGVVGWNWSIAVPFLAAEIFGVVQVLGFLYTIWPRPEPVLLAKDSPEKFPIFIFIPTVDEGTEILRPTLGGALRARERFLDVYPDAHVSIVICNDGRVANAPV